MDTLGYYLYNILGVSLLRLGIIIGGLINSKIRQGIRGRKHLFTELEQAMNLLPKEGPRFWVHSSSMGEFEQAKPLIAKIKRDSLREA